MNQFSRRYVCHQCGHKGRVSKAKRGPEIICPNCKQTTPAKRIENNNLAAEHAKAMAVINAIEERYIDGCDVHEDWKFMGQTAREYLVPSKINEGKRKHE